MPLPETKEFVNRNRARLKMVAQNGSKSASMIAEAMLSVVPEEKRETREGGIKPAQEEGTGEDGTF